MADEGNSAVAEYGFDSVWASPSDALARVEALNEADGSRAAVVNHHYVEAELQ